MINFSNILKALDILSKGAKVKVNGDNLEDIEWLDSDMKKPTDDEIKIVISNLDIKEKNTKRIIEIDNLLEKIDSKSIRAIREQNQSLLDEYEEEAVILRTERRLLNEQ